MTYIHGLFKKRQLSKHKIKPFSRPFPKKRNTFFSPKLFAFFCLIYVRSHLSAKENLTWLMLDHFGRKKAWKLFFLCLRLTDAVFLTAPLLLAGKKEKKKVFNPLSLSKTGWCGILRREKNKEEEWMDACAESLESPLHDGKRKS